MLLYFGDLGPVQLAIAFSGIIRVSLRTKGVVTTLYPPLAAMADESSSPVEGGQAGIAGEVEPETSIADCLSD
jgi:hypothetical protein